MRAFTNFDCILIFINIYFNIYAKKVFIEKENYQRNRNSPLGVGGYEVTKKNARKSGLFI